LRRAAGVWRTRPVVVGHRGGRGPGWPTENTIAAFEQARRQGARAVELDVRTSRGGEVVVFHDAALAHREDGAARSVLVRDAGMAELRALGVPTLIEALRWAREHDIGVNVEMKHDVPDRLGLARSTAGAVRASGANVIFSSFDPILLSLAGALAPDVPRAFLVHSGQPVWADVLQRLARPPWVEFVHLDRTQAHPATIAGLLRRGLRVGVWTVNDPEEAATLVRLGATSIITDSPGAVGAAVSRS
jgi:glycerophosphoryl diester phosphodiesterase